MLCVSVKFGSNLVSEAVGDPADTKSERRMSRGLIRYGERRCGVEVQTLLIYESVLLVWLAGWPVDC